jgi:hypothetical protein
MMTNTNDLGFSYLYDDKSLPEGDRRVQVSVHCSRFPHPPLAHTHPPELLIEGWGDLNGDYTNARHSAIAEAYAEEQRENIRSAYRTVFAAILVKGDKCRVQGLGTATYDGTNLIYKDEPVFTRLKNIVCDRTKTNLRVMCMGKYTLPDWA